MMPFTVVVWLALVVPGQTAVLKSRDARSTEKLAKNTSALELTYDLQRISRAAPVAHYPWGKCSTDSSNPRVIDSNEPCPPDCPFSQMVEGQSCEKLCVHSSMCRKFHPVLFFADIKTMQCTPTCGARKAQHIPGCSECLGPGICKRCARGLFGITQLELSEDGTKCVNVTLKWWYLFYSIAALLVLAAAIYLISMAWRMPENESCEDRLKIAHTRREEARTELMGDHAHEAEEFWHSSFHNMNTASSRGGRGIQMYFNWLIFGMLVAFTLAGGNFVAYELSDLGRRTQFGHASCNFVNPIEGYEDTAMSAFLRTDTALDVDTVRNQFVEGWARFGKKVVDAVRASVRMIANEAPPTGTIAERYAQVHQRMYTASITMYIIVVLLVFGFTVFQLGWVTARFANREPRARSFAAVVTGLPKDLFDGKILTEFFRKVLAMEDLEGLWQTHGGSRKEELQHVPLEDRFWVVGSSIAYDYSLQQEAIGKEIDSWVSDLDTQGISPSVPDQVPNDETSATSRGMQTETRGDILEQLRDEVPKTYNHPVFDEPLLKFVGLEEQTEPTLNGSGTAFVVFATEAARDAVVALAQEKTWPKFSMPRQNASSNDIVALAENWPYRLGVAAAHCEPVSVQWKNFGPFSNFVSKFMLSIFMILMTMFVWIVLSLPSAVFIADLALIPGVRPGFVQNLILGLLIAVGNQVIAKVVDLVTTWMGFHYKDSRDVAVLALAFIGTLVATIFDLCVVAITAHGMVLEDAFNGRDAGYEPVVANEIFGLTVPGYLVLPYLGMPLGEQVLPYFLAKYLIRSHGKITLRSATRALRSAEFDICWRYSDILNNTTICVVLLFFTSNRAWMTMSVLFLFMCIIYMIDKYLLLFVATPAVYDTHRLSQAFTLWWVLPTTMLATLISHWGWRSGAITSFPVVIAWPIIHAVVFLTALVVLEEKLVQTDEKEPVLYPDMVRRLQEVGRPWDFFNTNPVFCLRTRCLGADETGWKDVTRFQRSSSSAYVLQTPGAPDSPRAYQRQSDECVPFVRGSLRVLHPMMQKQAFKAV